MPARRPPVAPRLGAILAAAALAAGCVPAGTAPAATPAAPAAHTAHAATLKFHGTAIAGTEKLVGFRVTAIDVETGLAMPERADLVATDGPVVRKQGVLTSETGEFDLEFGGLTDGHAVRLYVEKGAARLEILMMGDGRVIGGGTLTAAGESARQLRVRNSCSFAGIPIGIRLSGASGADVDIRATTFSDNRRAIETTYNHDQWAATLTGNTFTSFQPNNDVQVLPANQGRPAGGAVTCSPSG